MGKHTGKKKRAARGNTSPAQSYTDGAAALALVSLAKTAKRELRRIAGATGAMAEVSRLAVEMLAEIKGELFKLYGLGDCLVSLAVELRDQRKAAALAEQPREANGGADAIGRGAIVGKPDFEPGRKIYFTNGECFELLARGSGAVVVRTHNSNGMPPREFSATVAEWEKLILDEGPRPEDARLAAFELFAQAVRNSPAPGDRCYYETADGNGHYRATVVSRGAEKLEIKQDDPGGGEQQITRSLAWWRERCDTPGASLYSGALAEYVSGEMLTTAQELDAAEIEKAGRA